MIYCVNQALDAYNWGESTPVVGLYQTYKDRPALLAAIMLMTTVPFQYEAWSTVPKESAIGRLEPILEGYLADSLYHNVGGKLIVNLIDTLTPYEFLQYLSGFDLSGLPIRQFYTTDTQLRLIITARVSVWLRQNPVAGLPALVEIEFKRAEQQVRGAVNGSGKSIH